MVPDFSYLENVIKVIQVEETYFKKEMIILLSADLEKAIAYIDVPIKSTSIYDPAFPLRIRED